MEKLLNVNKTLSVSSSGAVAVCVSVLSHQSVSASPLLITSSSCRLPRACLSLPSHLLSPLSPQRFMPGRSQVFPWDVLYSAERLWQELFLRRYLASNFHYRSSLSSFHFLSFLFLFLSFSWSLLLALIIHPSASHQCCWRIFVISWLDEWIKPHKSSDWADVCVSV